MKVIIINGSPKVRDSASGIFAKELEMLLGKNAQITQLQWNNAEARPDEMAAVAACDALVFAFPLYVDGIPSHLLRVLQKLEESIRHNENKPRVYAIVNSGFFEGNQNSLAIEMVKHWSIRAGLSWGMGIGIGGGPMLAMIKAPLGKGPKKAMGRAYEVLTAAIIAKTGGENQYCSPNFPRRFYIGAAHMGWKMESKKNGLKKQELYRQVRV